MEQLIHKLAATLGVSMVIAGLVLAYWSLTHLPSRPIWRLTSAQSIESVANTESPLFRAPSPLFKPSDGINVRAPARILLSVNLPVDFVNAMKSIADTTPEIDVVAMAGHDISESAPRPNTSDDFDIRIDYLSEAGLPVFDYYFAAATHLTSLTPELDLVELATVWQSVDEEADSGRQANETEPAIQSVLVLTDTLPALYQILGEPGPAVRGVASLEELTTALFDDPAAIALLPFDMLTPNLAVIPIDGQNPVENASGFSPEVYPLVAHVYAHGGDSQPWRSMSAIEELFASLSAVVPLSNRDPDRLTVIVMTGVTAMVRLTADQMDRRGNDWPAAEIGSDLASADITVISNEVPFVADCETDTNPENLVFCSKPEYMQTLLDTGVDLVGLTGNHQNDYGIENARLSLDYYAEQGLHIYGGGANLHDAMQPLVIEHNGNRLAFLGANSYGPPSAWATETRSGSAPFDLNIMSAQIRSLKVDEEVDVVLAELQYQESYHTEPLIEQRQDFKALVRAGADIVTGVQSHVPQAIELFEGRLILYGLGNLFFDQMWNESTRRGLIARHTIYGGRHISTQLLPTMLHEYGQPHWANENERALILNEVFAESFGQ